MADFNPLSIVTPDVSASRSHQGIAGVSASGKDNAQMRATLAGFEGSYALLNFSEGSRNELIRWPKNKIPSTAKIGDGLLLEAVSVNTVKEQEFNRMRELLEQLIN